MVCASDISSAGIGTPQDNDHAFNFHIFKPEPST